MSKYKFGLCPCPYYFPVTKYIFPMEVDLQDTKGLYLTVNHEIPEDATVLELYVNEIDAAFAAVVAVCQRRGISLVLWHYRKDTHDFYRQPVLTYDHCMYCGSPMNRGLGWYCPECGRT